MATVKRTKPYTIRIKDWYTDKQLDSGEERDLRMLTRFILEAPAESMLRQVMVEREHRDDFPRFKIERSSGRGYTLEVIVREEQNADAVAGELLALFEKNGWPV